MKDRLVSVKLVKLYESGRTEIVDYYDSKEDKECLIDIPKIMVSNAAHQTMTVLDIVIDKCVTNNDLSTQSVRKYLNYAFKQSSMIYGIGEVTVRDKLTKKLGINIGQLNILIQEYIYSRNMNLFKLILNNFDVSSQTYIKEKIKEYETIIGRQ